MRQDTLAHTTLYDFNGQPLASTISLFNDDPTALDPDFASSVLEKQDDSSLTRPLDIASIRYTERNNFV